MKLFKRIAWLIAIFFGFLGALIITVLLQSVSPEQKKPEVETFVFADTLANRKYDIDSLVAIIGNDKGLPEGFEIPAAIAYSAFPELKDIDIDMILTQEGAPMETTPEITSLFG